MAKPAEKIEIDPKEVELVRLDLELAELERTTAQRIALLRARLKLIRSGRAAPAGPKVVTLKFQDGTEKDVRCGTLD